MEKRVQHPVFFHNRTIVEKSRSGERVMFGLKQIEEQLESMSARQPDLFGVETHQESVEVTRLAMAVLSKTPDDLAAIAACNGLLRGRWLEAFERQKATAEADARFWSAAMAHLATGMAASANDQAITR